MGDTNDDVDSVWSFNAFSTTKIWAHADQRQIGFLGQAEFYNALRLVMVAQSKRELMPEMVKASLYGPAAAKIPAPKINLAATPAPRFNSAAAAPATQGGAVTPTSSQDHEFRGPQIRSQFNSAPTATQGGAVTSTSSQNLGFRGLSVNVNQQNFISQDGKSVRPPVPPSSSDSQPTDGVAAQGFPGGDSVGGPQPQNSSMSDDWVGGRASGAMTGIPSQVVNKGITPSATQDVFAQATCGPTACLPPRPQAGFGFRPPGPPAKDSKPSNISGNGFAPDSSFGVDVFSATPSQPKQNFPLGSVPVSSTIVPVSAGTQSSASPSTKVGGQPQPAQSFAKANNQVSAQTSATGVSPGAGNSASSQSHMSWPRMTQTDVQKYTNIFVKVDTDRDGKITGDYQEVEELEKEILDAREKIEYFQVKMQELVLYKSRCDNRLNEITERASADRREAESLAKKYEEKYKQAGDVASKLTIEEATFRDLPEKKMELSFVIYMQEKKMELYRAIVKMEQEGDAAFTLQGRVDRVQLDLDGLVKTLNECCKKYGLRGKPTTLTELPFGWQSGIQEGAADWDLGVS